MLRIHQLIIAFTITEENDTMGPRIKMMNLLNERMTAVFFNVEPIKWDSLDVRCYSKP